ncbi:hypothetical protein [Streptomyces sp. NPDC001137]|uniref:hypothetical protein n=1 Tax=Streptomyces sp. NPDC001137 TaxID=3154378 RepID=UPI0033236622
MWLGCGPGRHLSDAHGDAIVFHITSTDPLPGHGTWYQLHTSHAAAQEIYGGWHAGLALIPISLSELAEGPRQ